MLNGDASKYDFVPNWTEDDMICEMWMQLKACENCSLCNSGYKKEEQIVAYDLIVAHDFCEQCKAYLIERSITMS